MSKKYLIVPDMHQQVDAVDYLLEREEGNYDMAIFMGDYFDSFDHKTDAVKTAQWLTRRLVACKPYIKPNLGNHDLQYFFDPKLFRCSGYQGEDVRHMVHHIMRWPDNRDDETSKLYGDRRPCFKLHQKIGCWHITHAGLHPSFIPTYVSDFDKWFERELDAARANMYAGLRHPFLEAGVSRGGNQKYGGILWQDWSELEPIPGFHQLVGHTCHPDNVRSKITADSHNWCLDTDCCHAAIIDDESQNPNDIKIIRWLNRPAQGKRMKMSG